MADLPEEEVMPSIYDRKGKEKSLAKYKAEVWAHDLTNTNLNLYLRSKRIKENSPIERRALIKEYHERFPGKELPRIIGEMR